MDLRNSEGGWDNVGLEVARGFAGPRALTSSLGRRTTPTSDRDLPRRRGDDSDFEIAPLLVAGIEWRARRAADVLLELQLPGGDVHDAKLLVGWMFRAR